MIFDCPEDSYLLGHASVYHVTTRAVLNRGQLSVSGPKAKRLRFSVSVAPEFVLPPMERVLEFIGRKGAAPSLRALHPLSLGVTFALATPRAQHQFLASSKSLCQTCNRYNELPRTVRISCKNSVDQAVRDE